MKIDGRKRNEERNDKCQTEVRYFLFSLQTEDMQLTLTIYYEQLV